LRVIYPNQNVGAKPVLVDVDINTLNVLPETIENAITPKTKAKYELYPILK